jgi:hypothetical protein
MTVNLMPPTPPAKGLFSLGGANVEGFQIAGTSPGSSLEAPSGGLSAGNYTDVDITFTGPYSNSPQIMSPTLTATTLSMLVNISTSPAPAVSGDPLGIVVAGATGGNPLVELVDPTFSFTIRQAGPVAMTNFQAICR